MEMVERGGPVVKSLPSSSLTVMRALAGAPMSYKGPSTMAAVMTLSISSTSSLFSRKPRVAMGARPGLNTAINPSPVVVSAMERIMAPVSLTASRTVRLRRKGVGKAPLTVNTTAFSRPRDSETSASSAAMLTVGRSLSRIRALPTSAAPPPAKEALTGLDRVRMKPSSGSGSESSSISTVTVMASAPGAKSKRMRSPGLVKAPVWGLRGL